MSYAIDTMIVFLVNSLMDHDRKQNIKRMDDLIERNLTLLGYHSPESDTMRLSFRGMEYRHSSRFGIMLGGYRMAIPTTHPSIHDEVGRVVRELSQLKEDTSRIKQMLVTLLYNTSGETQSMRDILPDCLAQYFPAEYRVRMYPQQLEFRLKPFQLDQYNKILPLIEMYSVSKLLL